MAPMLRSIPGGQLGQRPGERSEGQAEQRAFNRHFPHGVNSQEKGEFGEKRRLSFFSRGLNRWALWGQICWGRGRRQQAGSCDPARTPRAGPRATGGTSRRQVFLRGIL